MAALIAFALSAAAAGGAAVTPAPAPTRASASAQAFVRILPGAKVSLSGADQPEGYKQTNATVTLEDGSRRPAKLVEFQ